MHLKRALQWSLRKGAEGRVILLWHFSSLFALPSLSDEVHRLYLRFSGELHVCFCVRKCTVVVLWVSDLLWVRAAAVVLCDSVDTSVCLHIQDVLQRLPKCKSSCPRNTCKPLFIYERHKTLLLEHGELGNDFIYSFMCNFCLCHMHLSIWCIISHYKVSLHNNN